MRNGLSTIHQTLTPEASAVLMASVSEATIRNHCQTTPLHVAATLLASPSGFFWNACIQSHPKSSCHDLELCFNVGLKRLASKVGPKSALPVSNTLMATLKPVKTQVGSESAPPISNALMIALKRAHAHQRRRCPVGEQQPVLAVKVELHHFVVSILDDPNVSRVMREAKFSSPTIKAMIEQSMTSPPSDLSMNMHLNPLLRPGDDEVKNILDIFSRPRKRNPILVGDKEPQTVLNEVCLRLERGDMLKEVKVIRLEKDLLSDKREVVDKIQGLSMLIEEKVGGVVVDMGDLKWLVEAGRLVIDELAKIVMKLGERGNGRLWLTGTATCETYMLCQIYYPLMEKDWDLQAVPITSPTSFPAILPRLGGNGTVNNLVESLTPMKTVQGTNVTARQESESLGMSQTLSCCPQCRRNYEQELAKWVRNEYEKSSCKGRSEPAWPPLPRWLQNSKFNNADTNLLDRSQARNQETACKQKTQELQKKWNDTCLHLHPNFQNMLGSQRAKPPMTLYNPKLLLHQPSQQKSQPNKALGVSLQLNSCLESSPKSLVRTDLVLGRPNSTAPSLENTDQVKDLSGCISPIEKYSNALDTDSYKKLLTEKVWWQKEAASFVASKMGRGTLSKGNMWLFFTGPDRTGMKKMAYVIAEEIFRTNLITISLGRRRNEDETAMNFRGKTVLDRIVEAVRRNPFSVIMLEDIDEADMLLHGSIKQAMEKGRLVDSYGREISLGNVVFILTASWLPDNITKLGSCQVLDEHKLSNMPNMGWQLRLRVSEKRAKRKADWPNNEETRLIKNKRESSLGISLDLNVMADFNDDSTDGSPNTSDLTIYHDYDQIQQFPITSIPIKLANFIDDLVVFKPVENLSVRNKIQNNISENFSKVVDDISLEVDEEALEKILRGIWLGKSSLEEWGEKVLLPSFRQLKTLLPSSRNENYIVRLEILSDSSTRSTAGWLPSTIRM